MIYKLAGELFGFLRKPRFRYRSGLLTGVYVARLRYAQICYRKLHISPNRYTCNFLKSFLSEPARKAGERKEN